MINTCIYRLTQDSDEFRLHAVIEHNSCIQMDLQPLNLN